MIKPKWLRDKPRKFSVLFSIEDHSDFSIWIKDFRGEPFLNLKLNALYLQDIIDGLREYDVRNSDD